MLNMVKWPLLSRTMSLCKDDGLQTYQWRTRWVGYELQSLRHSVCLKIRTPRIAVFFSALFFRLQSILIWSPGPGPSKRLVLFFILSAQSKKNLPLVLQVSANKDFSVWRLADTPRRRSQQRSRSMRHFNTSGCWFRLRPSVKQRLGRWGGLVSEDWDHSWGLKFEDTWLQKMLFCLNCVELSEYVPDKLEP